MWLGLRVMPLGSPSSETEKRTPSPFMIINTISAKSLMSPDVDDNTPKPEPKP